jgi:hypothetical protein
MFRSHLTVTTLAAVVGIFCLTTAVERVQAGEPNTPSLRIHGPIQVHHLDDGRLERGPRNEFNTSNWSGYAIGSYQNGSKYTSASATWAVPAVTFGQTQSGTNEEYSATWVGIGGFCLNALCSAVDRTLIQLGTSQYVSSSGQTSYFAWYEMLPANPVQISINVNPGDKISASLQCESACSGKRQNWKLSMTNNTTNQTWSHTFSYSSSLASADWIEEAPASSGGVLPLADFGVVGMVPYIGAQPAWNSLTVSANGIQMTDPWGQTSDPSSTDANGFNTCYDPPVASSCVSP